MNKSLDGIPHNGEREKTIIFVGENDDDTNYPIGITNKNKEI